MPIVERKNVEGSTNYVYELLPFQDILKHVDTIVGLFNRFSQQYLQLSSDMIDLEIMLLQEAVIRIDKRRVYFSIFHDETIISETKEAALWAYWIVKFKPISIKNDEICKMTPEQRARLVHINEKFAAYLIFCAVSGDAKLHGESFNVAEGYDEKLVYALKYWNLNKSAFLMIIESLCARISK